MAGKTITLALELDDSGAVKNLEQVQGELKQVGVEAKKAETSVDDLGNSLEKQEARIKTLGGAINIVGGAVEIAVGSFVALGLASEETAKQYEELLLSTIAIADGTKRVQEGYKELNEGLKSYGGVAGVAKKAQMALNAAFAANPIGVVVAALALLTAGIAVYVLAADDAVDASKEIGEAINEANKAASSEIVTLRKNVSVIEDKTRSDEDRKAALDELKKTFPGYFKDLKDEEILNGNARIATEELTNAILAKARAQAASTKLATLVGEELDLLEQQKQAQEDIAIAQQQLDEGYRGAGIRLESYKDNLNDATEALEANRKKQGELADFISEQDVETGGVFAPVVEGAELVKKTLIELPPYFDAVKEEIDTLIEAMGGMEKVVTGPIAKGFDDFNKRMEESIRLTAQLREKTKETTIEIPPVWQQYLNLIGEYNKSFVDGQIEFFESDLGKAIGAGLQSATNLARTIRETIDETTEEGFEKGKKARIAETRIASIQAAFSAYGGVVGVPIVGSILAPIAAATALLAGQKAINDIKSSSFNDQNVPSNPAAGSSAGGGSRTPNISAQFAQGGFLGPAGGGTPQLAPEQPIQAYVLASDVTTGLQAYGQISRRRRFG